MAKLKTIQFNCPKCGALRGFRCVGPRGIREHYQRALLGLGAPFGEGCGGPAHLDRSHSERVAVRKSHETNNQ